MPSTEPHQVISCQSPLSRLGVDMSVFKSVAGPRPGVESVPASAVGWGVRSHPGSGSDGAPGASAAALPRASDLPSFPSFLERAGLAGALAGTVAVLLLVARNGLAPVQKPLSFGLVLWKWYVLFDVALAVPAALAAWAAARALAPRVPPFSGLPRLALAVAGLAFLAVAFVFNPRALVALGSLRGPEAFRRLMPVAFVVAVLGLLGAALLPLARRAAVRLLAVLTAAVCAAALRPMAAKALGSERPAFASRGLGERLLVVGVDGADWDYIEPLMARGEMPHLATLRARGAWARLESLKPTVSPIIWTSIFTGRRPERHGITGFTSLRLMGVDNALPELRPVRALGFWSLYWLLEHFDQVMKKPVTSDSRRVPAFWNVASAYGSPVNVVGFWATWPAEPVLGNLVSDRTHLWPLQSPERAARPDRVTYPESLYGEIAGRIIRPDQVTLADARRFMDVTEAEFDVMRKAEPAFREWDVMKQFKDIFSAFETTRRVALDVVDRGRARYGVPPDTLVYFQIVDHLCHTSLRCSELEARRRCSVEDERRFGRVVSEAYRAVDAALGDLLRAFGPGDVVVLSDHGWEVQTGEDGPIYNHGGAPDGILVAAGPALRPGKVEGLSVYDVMPLLLHLKGFAVADDLVGKVPERVLAPEFLARRPVERIATYGKRDDLEPAPAALAVDDEMLERLRALGYIR